MRRARRSNSSGEIRATSPPRSAATIFSVEPSKNVSTRWRSAERRATSRGTAGKEKEGGAPSSWGGGAFFFWKRSWGGGGGGVGFFGGVLRGGGPKEGSGVLGKGPGE